MYFEGWLINNGLYVRYMNPNTIIESFPNGAVPSTTVGGAGKADVSFGEHLCPPWDGHNHLPEYKWFEQTQQACVHTECRHKQQKKEETECMTYNLPVALAVAAFDIGHMSSKAAGFVLIKMLGKGHQILEEKRRASGRSAGSNNKARLSG